MTERTSFYRKLAYMGAIVVLAFPIVYLSRPATMTTEGGTLAQLRKEYRLSQVNIGEIDPASETIKLATLGLRGVAVNWLWEKANDFKKREDWTSLTATLEQLAKLQPNFVTFWKFQAWNLSYNVSVEFDDYRDRYYYVRRGIQFLQEGEHYNAHNPQLLWDLGWFVGQKIGRADEYVQYRKLFKNDDDFHPADRSIEDRDNWLVAKEWYKIAIDAVDKLGQSLGRKSPRDFYSSPAKSQMNYAEAVEEEGSFDRARRAWQRASDEWRDFGERFIEHSTGVRLQLGSQKRLEKVVSDLRTKLDGVLPGVRKKIADEKVQSLKPDERTLLDTPREKLKPEQFEKRAAVEAKVQVTDRDVADRIAKEQPAKANEAEQLATDLAIQEQQLQFTLNYKRDANYDYWQNRAEFEQTPDALKARELMHKGHVAFRNADMPEAKRLYQEGFAKWRAVINAYPLILDEDQTTGGDILDFIKAYKRVLDQLDERIGDDFPLWDVIEKFDRENNFTEERKEHEHRAGGATAAPAKPQPTQVMTSPKAGPKAAAPNAAPLKSSTPASPSSSPPSKGAPTTSPAKTTSDSTKK